MNSSQWYGGIANLTSGLTFYPTTISASGTALPFYVQPQPLVSVLDSPSAPLSDRAWLDAQIAEVCDLARAA